MSNTVPLLLRTIDAGALNCGGGPNGIFYADVLPAVPFYGLAITQSA